MAITVEVDEAGCLTIPRTTCEALHLAPGTRVSVEQQGPCLKLEIIESGAGLFWINGRPVYDHGHPLPPEHVHWLDEAREERAEQLMGIWNKE